MLHPGRILLTSKDQLLTWRGAAIMGAVLLIAGVLCTYALHLLANQQESNGRTLMQLTLERTVAALSADTTHGQPMGAAILLGLNEPVLKELSARGKAVDPHDAEVRMTAPRLQFGAEGVYVIDHRGTVVAHATAGLSSVGINVAFRPYFRRALQGLPSIYAAVGSNTDERGIYFAAPMRETTRPDSDIIGVITIKMPSSAIDAALNRMGKMAVLLSPQGVAFASTRNDWLLAVTAPLTNERLARIRQLKQFGHQFDDGTPKLLPFDPDATMVSVEGVTYGVERQFIDWADPAGAWELVALQDTAAWHNSNDPGRTTIVLFILVAALLVGALLLRLDVYRRVTLSNRRRLHILGTALTTSPAAVAITNPQGNIEWVNAQFETVTGYGLAHAMGQSAQGLIDFATTPKQQLIEFRKAVDAGQPWRGELRNRRRDGALYWDSVVVTPVYDKQQLLGHVSMLVDITPQKELEADLLALAHFDKLTGLPNRALFVDRLHRAAVTAKRERNQFALLFIDLDGFKKINDSQGHDAGDAVLKSVGQSLRHCVRETDTVARMGGDEFTVILTGLHDRQHAATVARKMISALSQPISVTGAVCQIGASIGIGIFPDDADDTDTLLKLADSAMYEVKRTGKNAFRYFADTLKE